MPTIEIRDDENAPLLKGGNSKVFAEGPLQLSSTEMILRERLGGIRYFRATAGVYLTVIFALDFFHNVLHDPLAFILELSVWVHFIAILYFALSSYIGFKYLGFGEADAEEVRQGSSSGRSSSWLPFDWPASTARVCFQIGWSISAVVMLIFWITEIQDPEVSGKGIDLFLNLNNHVFVFCFLFFDLLFNRITFKLDHLIYLAMILLVYGFIDASYLFSTAVDKTDTVLAFILLVVFIFLSFLVGMGLTHFRDSRDANVSEEDDAQWKLNE